jgi:hypothetical protein
MKRRSSWNSCFVILEDAILVSGTFWLIVMSILSLAGFINCNANALQSLAQLHGEYVSCDSACVLHTARNKSVELGELSLVSARVSKHRLILAAF